MSGDEGAQPPDGQEPGELDGTYQAAMRAAMTTPDVMDVVPAAGVMHDMQEIARIQQRADTQAQLAQAMSASTHMVVDPDQVDALATFMEDEAQGLQERAMDVQELAMVQAPGTDPVSTQAAPIHGQVAAGDDQAYLENYLKLAKVFQDTAASLRSSAQQTRTDDENAADSFRQGSDVA